MSLKELLLAVLAGDSAASAPLADLLEEQGHVPESQTLRQGMFLPAQSLWLATYVPDCDPSCCPSQRVLFTSKHDACDFLYQSVLDECFGEGEPRASRHSAVHLVIYPLLRRYLLEQQNAAAADLALALAHDVERSLACPRLSLQQLPLTGSVEARADVSQWNYETVEPDICEFLHETFPRPPETPASTQPIPVPE